MGAKITRHQELDVYQKSFAAAMHVFEVSKQFPKEEMLVTMINHPDSWVMPSGRKLKRRW